MQQGKAEEVSAEMMFELAGFCYELHCEGWTYRRIGEAINRSHEYVRSLLKDCMENGKDAKSLHPMRGTCPRFNQQTLKTASLMRESGMCWKTIARELDCDSEQIRKAHQWFNNPMNRIRQRQKRAEQPR